MVRNILFSLILLVLVGCVKLELSDLVSTQAAPVQQTYTQYFLRGEKIRIVVKSKSKMRFKWNENTEPDLAGYDIFKGSDTAFHARDVKNRVKINESLLTESTFIDDAASSLTEASYYSVTASDKTGNRSNHSMLVWTIGVAN